VVGRLPYGACFQQTSGDRLILQGLREADFEGIAEPWHAVCSIFWRTPMSIPLPRPSGPTLLRRFTLLSLGTTIAVGIIFGAITARLVEDFALRRQSRATATRVLEMAGARLSVQDFLTVPPSQPQFERAMRPLVGKIDIIHVTVWNRLGQVLYSDGRVGFDTPVPPSALLTIVRKSSGDLERQEWALHRSFIGIIRSLINALDARDMATAHHSSRVADNAVLIAQAMGLDEAAVSEVQVAGFLHDVGKIG